MNNKTAKSRNVLIIGGGYLGTCLYGSLAAQGGNVVLSDVLSDRSGSPLFRADIADRIETRQLAERIGSPGVDTIYMCVSTKGGDEEQCRRVYLEGVANLIEYFPSAKIIYCSSSSLYGETLGRWVDETTESLAMDAISDVLLQAEQMVRRTGGIVARLSAVYGPGRCVLLERLQKSGRPISGAPERWLNYIHRDDAVSALMLLGEEEREESLVNISDENPMTLGEIYKELSGLLCIPEPAYLPPSPGRRRGRTNQRVSCKLLRSYGWVSRYPSVLDGIRSIIDENRPRP